ncbi:MAG TPA: polysaccharide deacetylase family protein [Kineosporiaceae bacterium]|nr:polysaccharide deacetylase family protein [Kineosporiaceae bacterium]
MMTTARRAVLLLIVPVALAVAAAAPARAVTPPAPVSEGPWPPRDVLATDPTGVPATADVVSSGCPATTATVLRAAPGSGKTVALTFDDGPGATTGSLLSILQQYGVTATFVNLGLNATRRPADVRSAAAIGAQLANHTWDHPRLTSLGAAAQGDQMDAASAEQQRLVGSYPCAFRPPYGDYTSDTVSQATQRRMSFWTWSVDTEDWKAGTSTSSSWVDRIVSLAEAGGSQTHPVILMHNPPAGVPATVIALPTIIRYYRDHGYRFVDLLGQIGQYPAPAVAPTNGGIQVVVRLSDRSIGVRTQRSSWWTSWSSLGGAAVGGPGAAAPTTTSTAVAVLGTDNAVWFTTRSDAGVAGGWTSLGGLGTSKPALAQTGGGRLTVAVRGADRAVWLRSRSPGGSWGPWTSVPGAVLGAPALAATADGQLTLAAVGVDGVLQVAHRTGSAWSVWRRLPGVTVTAEPALASTAGGAGLVSLVRGGDGSAWTTVGDASGATWSAWTSIGGALTSGAGVTARGTTLETFVYGTDGRLWLDVASNGAAATGWGGWQLVP